MFSDKTTHTEQWGRGHSSGWRGRWGKPSKKATECRSQTTSWKRKELSKCTHSLRREPKGGLSRGLEKILLNGNSKRCWAIQSPHSSPARNTIPRLSCVTRTAPGVNWKEGRVQAKSVHRPCRQDERLQASEPLLLSHLRETWVGARNLSRAQITFFFFF